MRTELSIQDKRWQLHRYPPEQQHVSLQAWDAADEYIYQYLQENPELQMQQTAVLNDDFGALACMLPTQICAWYSDSKVAALAMQQNWHKNVQSTPEFSVHNNLSDLPDNTTQAILKLPKNNSFLAEQLITLRALLPKGALVITAGKANQIQKSTLALFEKHLGSTHTSLAVKKARLIFTRVNKTLSSQSKFPLRWPVENSGLQIANLANVFSSTSLDIGARFLLEHLPDCQNKQILDLGCGNGVLSVHAAQQKPAKIHCVDESAMAVASAQLTLQANFPAIPAAFFHSNSLEQVPVEQLDVILCNPPFHQQNTITDHIAWQMFNDAKKALKKGGELRIVGNRHLNYHEKLKRLFGGCKVVASNRKFVILSSIKR
ncbi:methyltransferase [Planctobacterium marinum]|uniref:Ribosomal RNA large subunit methyltransferase G n=1 Tax=Planctobacterium marinum TaxID=1631968 RepID=A0AA48HKW9_9ALTE|nr:ribosomal RNA large subunit methyltransferase G [Planctobacterium marinum]